MNQVNPKPETHFKETGRRLPRRERHEKDFSAPSAGFGSNKYETGPTRTGTVSIPSCTL
ncbi:hypothetical protein MKW94_001180 [Papaver nudicaule]|uniref:Uncharacterized protein n=1 Tax=Papaver nudicaule TaxID=74823 RepID=A0AA41VNZ6_PAPNU|nr:hypothetical protein [Papaver nudicaule]